MANLMLFVNPATDIACSPMLNISQSHGHTKNEVVMVEIKRQAGTFLVIRHERDMSIK